MLRQPQRLPASAPPPAPQPGVWERLREAERRCTTAEESLRPAEADAPASASAVARLSAALDKERARAGELERVMGAIRDEFSKLTMTATELARRSGASPAVVAELRRTWERDRADPDHAAVGLHQSAPDFLVTAAREAFRKAHHPDTKDGQEKAAAEAAFKRHEAAFDRLIARRRHRG